MLESYVSPFLLGYIDKYIKNLKPEDLQLSLWGGDLVLNKLDLRLDVLEQELNLPMTFVSGHIHELRIHVPWHKLGSEPVVITINTIECALKLRDSAYSDKDSVSSKSSNTAAKLKNDGSNKAKRYEEQDHDLPPGYVQSLMNRVINNVNIVIKNLILKYVEDDIVLSVNIKSVDTFTVDHNWQKAFIDLTMPELVLRRIIHFSDLTMCLDKRNASGKIETYQEPVVYRCFLKTRIHQTYSSMNAKRASVVKINTYCDELDMSLSDTQLPMFLRILQLLLALYYGTLEVPGGDGKDVDEKKDVEEDGEQKDEGAVSVTEHQPTPLEIQQGWVSWAWSYVPELVYYEDEEGEDPTLASSMAGRKRPDPIVAFGLYCRKGKILFKLTDTSPSSQFSQFGQRKLSFKPLLQFEINGSTIEILMKGDPFFDMQIGFSFWKLSGLGMCVCGAEDCIETTKENKETCFFQAGNPKFQQKEIHFLYNSLFELGSAENQLQRASYIVDVEQHQAKNTENWGLQRFGAFWLDYVYTMEVKEDKPVTDKSSNSSHRSEPELIFDLMETSSKRFLLAPIQMTVYSGMVHRIQRFMYCAGDHEYEPYSTPQPEIVDENRPVPTAEQVTALEEAIPSRSTHITLLDLNIIILAADHPPCHSTGFQMEMTPGVKPNTIHLSKGPLPAVCLQSERIDIQSTVPMYGRRLVRAVSRLPQASGNLMHHCYDHMYLKLFGCQIGLSSLDTSSDIVHLVLNILPSCSAAAYKKNLELPMYWTDSNRPQTEVLVELPGVSINVTKAQVLMLLDVYQSWLTKMNGQPSWCQETNLMDDVFKPSAKTVPGGQPVLNAMATNVELKYSESQVVRAASGTIGKAYVAMQALDKGQESTTILYQGPLDTSQLHSIKYLQSDSPVNSDLMNDLMTFTIQLPKTKGDAPVSDGCGIILVDIQGSSVCLDPIIYTWLLYQPRQFIRSKVFSERASSVESSKKKPSSKESTSHPKEVQPGPQKIPTKPKQSERKLAENEKEEKSEGKDDFLMDLWSTLKRLTVQIDLQSCFITFPTQHMTFDPTSQNIPQCLRHCILGNTELGVSGLVVTTPTVSIQSVGHRKMSPLQEIPLHWKDLPPDTGEKLPWNVRASNFSIYTAYSPHTAYYLLHPMAMAATLGVTASAATPSAIRPSLGLCIHADMQAVTTCVSHPQMLLMYSLSKQIANAAQKIPTAFSFTPSSSSTLPFTTTQVPTSPSKSMRVLSSVTSSGQPEAIETTSISSPIESLASPRPTDEETPEIKIGLKLSLWLQWTLQKFVVKLYGKENEHLDTKMKCTVEDLTTSIDVQDVYSKISCKVGALNVMHYAKKESSWHRGAFKGVVFSCGDTITHDTQILGVNIANKPAPRSFNPFAASNTKPTDIKKAHSFLTFTWTRALSKSVSQKMFGRKVENLTKLSPEEQASARQHFVNEVIIASRPFDLVLWCPVLSSITRLFSFDTQTPDPRTSSEQMPLRSRRKRSPSSASLKSASESQATRLSTHKKVPSDTTWMTNQTLPLIYMDCKDFRVFVPAIESPTKDRDVSGKEQGDNTMEGDTFVLQVNSVVLSPHADNPLQRLVVKKDIYRKAVQSGITDRPGSEVEDRQYQLDIDGMTMSVASWRQIETVTDQSKSKPPSASATMTQNPALEWNTSLPRQNPGVVGLTPILYGFDLRVIAAPAIVMGKAVVCGHSLEVNATSDITFYISTEHVCLMQTMLEQNMQSLTNPAPKQDIWIPPLEGASSNSHQPQSHPAGQYRKPLHLEDSGIGSEESLGIDISNQLQQITVDVGAPPKSLHSPRPVVMRPKLIKRTSVMPSHNRPAKPKSKRLTPSDILFTAGKINVILYSKESGNLTSSPIEDSGSVQQLNGSGVAVEFSIASGGKIQPFLHLEVSQPSAIASLERHQQKVEFSIYDVSLDGASVRNSAVESTEPLPSAPNYTVPWFETCPGEPDSKTGVRPSLVTLTVGNILSKKANLKVKVARPVKANLSLTKIDQCMEFVKKMSLPKKVEIDTRPKAKHLADGKGTPSHRSTADTVPLIIPAMGQVPPSSKPSDTSSSEDAMNLLLNITDVTMDMVQFVVVMATHPDPQYPHVVLSVGSCRGKAEITNDIDGKPSELASSMSIKDLQVKTSLEHKTRPLLGPVTMETSVDARWDTHNGGGVGGSAPRMAVNLHLGHVPICFGQEHLTCCTLMQERVMQYLGTPEQSKPKPKSTTAPSKQINMKLAEESSNDDLRVGAFKYITDSEGSEIQPKPNEIIFSCPPPPDLSVSGTEDYGSWGSMSWCYPQPRVLTRVSVTPIPLHLADRPEEMHANHIEEIPCTLEYWDDMRKCFHIYKQLYVSEIESFLFAIDMPLGENHLKIGEATAAQIWRIVLNSVAQDSEDVPLSQTCRKDLIITPTALAASMRIDSYFALHLIPTAKIAFNMDCLEIRLTHHLSQLGQAQPHQMKPFKFDGVAPNEQEYMVITINNTELYGQHWSGVKPKSAMQLATSVQCDLLTYRNLNMTPFLEEAGIESSFEAHWGQDINFLFDLGSVEFRVGQGSIHNLNMALQAWNQYGQPEEEQLLFTYFTICNDTSEALRFGQVHTDEALVLGSRQMHAYSWRTHKHHEQFLHVCIEGWRNWRWSEPFNIDKPGTIVRTLEYKDQKATLFIKVKQISSLQKQVIFYGQQIFSSRLTETLEVQLLHVSRGGSQLVDSSQVYNLSSKGVLPSLTCADEDISGVRVKVADQEGDWSEQFAISGEMSRGQVIVMIPCKDGPPLRVWCGIQTEEIHGYTQRLVVFSPLFIVRSHLPRPLVINLQSQKLQDLQLVEAAGRGSDQPLHHIPSDVWYNMTFQLSQTASPSSPSIPISTELIHQVTPQPDEDITMESLCEGWAQDLNAVWPYNQPEYDSSISYPCSLRHTGLPEDELDQPNTDLQVSLCQYWAKLNTVLIDVMPWCLVVNETDRDMLILEDGERPVRCGQGQTVSPQRFKGPFHLCAITEEHIETNWSSPIHLLTEPTSPRADGLVTGTLTLSGEGFVNIHLPNQYDNKTVHVTLTSTVQHNVRVMTIRPRFVLVNNTKRDLKLRAVHVAVGEEKPNIQQTTLYSQFIPSNPSSRNPLPVYEWNVLPANQPDQSPVGFQHCVQLFSLAVCPRYEANQPTMTGTDIWSSWIPVDEGRPRQPATLLDSEALFKRDSDDERTASLPVVAILQEHQGIMYMSLEIDPTPLVTVHSTCLFPLHIGQAMTNYKEAVKTQVVEEVSILPSIPVLPANSIYHYDLQQHVNSNKELPTIHLSLAQHPGAVVYKNADSPRYQWSEGIILAMGVETRSEIVALTGGGYVLVTSFNVGRQTRVAIDPLTMSMERGYPVGEQNQLMAGVSERDHQQMMQTPTKTQPTSSSAAVNQECNINLEISKLVIKVMDEVTDLVMISEIMRATFDDIRVASYPVEDIGRKKVKMQMISVVTGPFQIDNQLFHDGKFDFGVLFKSRHKHEDESYIMTSSPERSYEGCRFTVCLESNEDIGTNIANVQINLKNSEVFIEDQFLYEMMTRVRSYVPASQLRAQKAISSQKIPSQVMARICALRTPVGMRNVEVGSIAVLASIHASLKVFIAVDRTLLSFGQLETGPVFASSSQLIEALTMHFTSGALFKAGWALGSLEILGNPAGFLRSVKLGLTDTVWLPYEGLTRGPAAFVSGVTNGVSSLVKHVSAGTLTSVTKFASSVARNLDRLSLDADHIARQEAHRRRAPDRVTEGLMQGLSGFGISILGAIAGIADQPLQSIQEASGASTPTTAKAKGIITGVGKGLVGVVIKPLGGAAEFVAQTGQGILHGAGLADAVRPRSAQYTELSAMSSNSRLKYTWKMLHSLPNADIIMHVDVTSVTFHGLHRSGCLLLTPEILFVVSASEDTQQQAFPVSDVECIPRKTSNPDVTNSSLMCIVPKRPTSPSSQEKEDTTDRVAEFVDKTSGYATNYDQLNVSSDSQSEASSPSMIDSTPTYQYFMNRQHRETFLTLFMQAKNRLSGKGFCYDETSYNTNFSRFKTWHLTTKAQLDD